MCFSGCCLKDVVLHITNHMLSINKSMVSPKGKLNASLLKASHHHNVHEYLSVHTMDCISLVHGGDHCDTLCIFSEALKIKEYFFYML